MRKRRFLLSLGILLAAIALILGVLGFLLKLEPEFYTREMDIAVSREDQSLAINTVDRITNLQAAIFRDKEWGATFTAEDVNALLRENKSRGSDLSTKLFGQLEDPRVAIDGDILKLAFRYGEDFWSTVVSIELRMWLVKDEVNTIAIEIVSLSAGKLPLNKSWPLDQITEILKGQHAEISWFSHKGNPVGLCRLFVDRPQRDTRIQGLKLDDGRISIVGRHTDSSSADAVP